MRMIVAAAVAVTFAGTAALAQQKAPAAQQKASAASVAFAKKVASANSFEKQSSELAQDRAQSGDVKSFARQLVEDQTKVGQDFKSALEAANISPPAPQQLNAKQKAALSKLQSAHGPAFDKAYLTAQLRGGKEAVSVLRKYAKSGRTAQLKEFAQKTLPLVEQRLSELTQLRHRAVAAGRTGVGSRAIGPPARTAPMREKTH
jgi:putative membrane protein